jgi:hypothetical protein
VLSVGQTLGNYRVESRLSEGGMATLVLGRQVDQPDAPLVAIKVIHEHLSEDWQFLRMFVDEALISVRLRHPNVVRVDELGEQNNMYFLVMEYVRGCSLAQLLRAMGKQGRRMRPEIAVWIVRQIAAGLHAAHEMTGQDGAVLGVIHRDVSPQNVLISIDGEVKLLDFGIAKARGRAERTEAGVIKGKVRYMSPEQAAGDDIDRRVDIYALGVVLWEMLTMRRYIDGKSEIELLRKVRSPDRVPPSVKADGIPSGVDEAVMSALAVKQKDRPPTAEHFAQLLSGAVPDAGIGPAHVAELIRVFVGQEIEEAARALPAAVGDPIAKRVRGATPLPGESVPSDERSRVETLTRRVPKGTLEDKTDEEQVEALDDSTGAMEADRPPEPPRIEAPAPKSSAPSTAAASPKTPSAAKAETSAGPHDGDDDEATLHASEPLFDENAQTRSEPALRAASAFAAASPAAPGPIPPTAEHRAPVRADAPVPATSSHAVSASKETSSAGWVVRIALITLLAFAVGAGFAVAWVEYLAD